MYITTVPYYHNASHVNNEPIILVVRKVYHLNIKTQMFDSEASVPIG